MMKINPLNSINTAFRGLKFKEDFATQNIINREIPYVTSVFTGSGFYQMERDYHFDKTPCIKNDFERLRLASEVLGYDIEISENSDKVDKFYRKTPYPEGENVDLTAKITDKETGATETKECTLSSFMTEARTPYEEALPDFIKEILFRMIIGK